MLSFQHSAGLNARQPSHTAQPIQLRQGGMRRLAKTTTKKDLSVTFKGKFRESVTILIGWPTHTDFTPHHVAPICCQP